MKIIYCLDIHARHPRPKLDAVRIESGIHALILSQNLVYNKFAYKYTIIV